MSVRDDGHWGDQHRGIPFIVKRPVLPIELIQCIVDCLDVTDGERTEDKLNHTALSSCSLVSHVWHDICCPRIFRSITIRSSTASFISRFSYLHSTAPHLRKYVQVLRLVFSDKHASIAPPAWLKECLGGFENLRTLQLDRKLMSVSYSPSGEDHWMQWITDLLATAPRVLAMDNWAFDSPDRLLHILAASSTLLEDLSLRRINVSTPIQSPEAEPVSIAPTVTRLDALRNLTLCCYNWVLSSVDTERAV
ncbi:hypothetical protein PC9H_006901 [Pleurotus ostreatus]|uniref:F-box domain-containing protein n=1 Tax=Pleurotus ostreatus TaxID=5322 RepID=A0A8H6ZX35_PLEOS|nr:uncharacterized protein PC9H_006901 [Pleurotus ostreatus]KAF7431180.1 hypothetical protein PC9H_006901 [Pleurotus ostreatus]